MAQFYDYKTKKYYKELTFSCRYCDWSGVGEQAKEGIDSSSGFPLLCPKCGEYIEWISIMVSHSDIMNYGSEKEKEEELKRVEFLERVWASELKSPDQLPEIEGTEIIITLREEEKNGEKGDAHIVLCWNEKELWREVRSFEYYPRYLELGKILKEKYGERLIDFEAKYTVHLGGDKLSAFDIVRKFRKSLSNKSHMSNAEFDFITQSGWFDKDKAFYWRAFEFAKERHAGQVRDEGTPYFEHIIGVIDILRESGYISDYYFTVAALHDVLEDTSTTEDEVFAVLCGHLHPSHVSYTEGRNIVAEVELLTHEKEDMFKEYIDRIFMNESVHEMWGSKRNGAAVVKLADRLHNLTTLPLCREPDKILRKIHETEEYIMPWRDKFNKFENLFAQIETKLNELKSTL